MKTEEIEWEIRSVLVTGSPFFSPREVEAMQEACRHISKSETYRKALLEIQRVEPLDIEVNRIIIEAFDAENE